MTRKYVPNNRAIKDYIDDYSHRSPGLQATESQIHKNKWSKQPNKTEIDSRVP